MGSKNTTIYIKDKKVFDKMCKDIKEFWWENFKESISNNDIIHKGIVRLHNDTISKPVKPLSEKYGRLNDN